MSKKKLLITADTYLPKIDGIMRVLKETVPRFADGFDITFLIPYFGTSWKFNEVKLKVSRFIKLSGYPLLRIGWSNFKKIKNAVKEADTVFIHGPALISVLAIYYAQKFKKKTIYYIHTNIWELYRRNISPFLRWVTPLLKRFMVHWYNRCDALIVPYSELADDLKRWGVKTKKEVVQLGVDPENFTPAQYKTEAKLTLGIDPNKIVIGYVGRISKEKNVIVLLDAFKKLKDYDVELLIVGSGDEDAMKPFKDERVLLPGFQKDVVPYFQAMDIFVMPSLTETTSLATLEAMSCGVPVVTTKVGFLKKYVKKNYNGLLFPKGNTYNLVLQLKRLIEHPELRSKLGNNARATAQTFSWTHTAQRFKELLQRY